MGTFLLENVLQAEKRMQDSLIEAEETAAASPLENASGAVEPEDLGLQRDKLSSAQTLYQAGRGCYKRGDLKTAKLYFGLAENLFRGSDEASRRSAGKRCAE